MTTFQSESEVLRIIKEHVGEACAIKDPEIRQQATVPDSDRRKEGAGLREVINRLRQMGFPICSSTNGYWWAKTPFELRENIEALEGRAAKIFKAVAGMKKALEAWQNENKKTLF